MWRGNEVLACVVGGGGDGDGFTLDKRARRWRARDRRSTSSESRGAVTFPPLCHVCRPWQQSIWGPRGTKRVLKPNQTGWKEKGETLGPSRLPLVWAIHLWLTRSGILNKPCTSWTAEKPHSGTWRRPCICESWRVLFENRRRTPMFALLKVRRGWNRNLKKCGRKLCDCVSDSRRFSSRLFYSTSRLSSQICNYFCLLFCGGEGKNINQIGLTYAFVFVAEL